MREILFKAIEVNSGEWIESMTISNGTIKRKSRDLFMEVGGNQWKGIKPETLCQFTGLTDKNGTKIFEGDKVLVEYNLIGEIVVSFSEPGAFNIGRYKLSKCLITGNIHDK